MREGRMKERMEGGSNALHLLFTVSFRIESMQACPNFTPCETGRLHREQNKIKSEVTQHGKSIFHILGGSPSSEITSYHASLYFCSNMAR